ncbi:unnamed protein product [Camellia sinensis]
MELFFLVGLACSNLVFRVPQFQIVSRRSVVMEIQHFSHNHPLNLVDQVAIFATCQCCEQIVTTRNTPSYKCLKFGCWFHIHKLCTQLPQQLSHPFHPQHPLTLLPHPPSNGGEFRCQACGKARRGFTFHCSTCQFNLDINCASLKPQINQQISIRHFSHTNLHTLDLCNKDKNFDVFCSACESQFQDHDSIYVCLECKLLLHKPCAELPQKIDHHAFHPQHSLVLYTKMPPWESFKRCKACWKDYSFGFNYRCVECKFILGIECAFLMPRKFEFHEHPLALFNRTMFRCSRCSCGKCSAMLRCVLCGFNIHIHCVPILPDTIKGRCHRHPLTLTYSPIRDHPDEDETAELYCDDCEELRYLIDPTYHCKECHYVAHVECMISKEDVFLLGEESLVVGQLGDMGLESSSKVVKEDLNKHGMEKKEAIHQESDIGELINLAELDKEIESLTAKLEALKQKRARYTSK